MSDVKISIGFPPGPEVPDLAVEAEALGYDRVWLYDSAALYEDIWIHLALVAERTERVGLGTAVLVPNLRHVMATASAIATVDRLAPGRLAVALGTGFTARLVLNKKALTWATTERYVRQLKGLLAGETVEIDGEQCQMIHRPEMAAPRPYEIPILLSAFGPKGQGVAEQVADGLMHIAPPSDDRFDWWVQMINGTVLDPGEAADSDRVKDAAGPWEVLGHHATWHLAGPEIVRSLPRGEEWLAEVDADRPDGQRHLAVHEGHCSHVADRDLMLLDGKGTDDSPWGGWVGEADDIAARIDASAAAGVTEILYTPAGHDLSRETRAFAAAAGL